MLKVFFKYLYAGDSKLKLTKIPKALKFSISYYKERKSLKKKHNLRLIDLPYILRLQYRFDKANKSYLANQVSSQLYKEKSDQFHEFLSQKHIISVISEKLKTQRNHLNELGIIGYSADRIRTVWKHLRENIKVDSISKFIVKYVNLYHKALESLVDGHREVTRNHDTILDDGKTVKEKLENFEEMIKGETNFIKDKIYKK